MRIGRITVEILGPVPLAPLTVEARVVRPGRSVELLEASLAGPDGEVMRASAWRVAVGDVSSSSSDPPPPGPDQGRDRDFFPTGQEAGYHTAMEYRFVHGGFLEPGPALVWMRMRGPLVEGRGADAAGAPMVVADVGNGVSAVLDWREYLFINTELTVHLLRPPDGEWVGVDAVHPRRRRRARRDRALGRARAPRQGRPDAARARTRGLTSSPRQTSLRPWIPAPSSSPAARPESAARPPSASPGAA